MRRLLAILLFVSIPINLFAGPRSYGKSGTATTTNATVTLPFHPVLVCVANDSTSIAIKIDYRDGIATLADESTNQTINAGETYCWTFVPNISPSNTFAIGLITASSTAAYRINASRAN